MCDDCYELIDSGDAKKLERFGAYLIERPCVQAVWRPQKSPSVWRGAHASFDRQEGARWHNRTRLPDRWTVTIDGLRFILSAADSGQVGVFPEQRVLWSYIAAMLTTANGSRARPPSLLNCFAYSGGTTVAAARSGATVCHLDASRGMVERARENAARNGLAAAPIRWIVDDALKFLRREKRRGHRYDAIVLDPPTFGRGRRGETFTIGKDLPAILACCEALLSDTPLCVLISCHTPDCTPPVLRKLLAQALTVRSAVIESGELTLTGKGARPIRSGTYARWCPR